MENSLARVRISASVKDEVDEIATSDQRTLQTTLDILLKEAINSRRKLTRKTG